MSDLDNAIQSINTAAARTEGTTVFIDNLSTYDENSSITNPNNGVTVPSIAKQVKTRTDELFEGAESDINQSVADAAKSASDAEASALSLGYQGLWPDTGGSAYKGDTYQTQVGGTPTGQYFTALQDTTVDPVGDDVNWRVIIGAGNFGSQEVTATGTSESRTLADWQRQNLQNQIFDGVDAMLAAGDLLEIGQLYSTGGTTWKMLSKSDPVVIGDFKEMTDVSVVDFGADPTGINDSLQAFIDAVSVGGRIYSPVKGTYYLSNIISIPNDNTSIDLNGSSVVWKGEIDIGNNSRGFGIFDIKGSMSAMPVATVTSDMTVGSQSVALNSGHPFSVGDYMFIEALPTNDQTTGLFPKLGYLTRISKFDGDTAITDYKCAWNVPASTILIYSVSPIKNVSVKNVHLDDQMVATPSPDSDTTAPTVERNKAVMLVNMVDAVNCHHENLSVDNGKFPMVLGKRVSDCSVSRSEYNNPVWFAGGEGYGAAWINALRCDSIDLITRGDRHNTDYSLAAYCNTVRCTSSGGKQFSFTTHGAYEHDITWDQCSGFWFRPASAGFADYGNVLKNGYVKNSKFNNTGGRGINIQFENSQLGVLGGAYAKLSFLGATKTTDINIIRFDDRVTSGVVDTVLGDKFDDIFADSLSKLAFNTSCEFTGGWDRIEVKGEIRGGGVTGQAEMRLKGVSESNFIDATFFKSRVQWSGVTNEISVTGSTVKNKDTDESAFFYTRDVSTDDVLMVDFSSNFINGNKLVGSSSRPVQFQSFAQTVATDLSITSANNTYKDCGGAAVFNSGENYTISNAKIHKNNIVNSGEVLVIGVPDSGLYESGDVNPTKGSSGGPAVWNGTAWVDLT